MASAVSEEQRLDALRRLRLLDVEPHPRFQLMVQMAQHWFDVPMVSITLVDEHRQWRFAFYGELTRQSPVEGAICPFAMHALGTFVVTDTTRDNSFADSPDVLAGLQLRFYAGWPLRAPGGEPIGSFCVMDTRPRAFTLAEEQVLADLGRWVEQELHREAAITGRAEPRNGTVA